MRAIMVMFDSLNRKMLSPYGCDWMKTPNFARLAEKTVTFDTCFVGSMPCMPARRELHTGRYNFLHRSWGPMEPFDDSMPEILKDHGVHTHLTTDHYHYFEDGGATYHTRYRSYEAFRGQEGDAWKGVVGGVARPENLNGREALYWNEQDFVNRSYMDTVEKQPQTLTFDAGLHFMERNKEADNWFLQIETFDPHEPFYSQQRFKALYPHEYHGKLFDWPLYQKVTEDEETVNHLRMEYAALLSMCDESLGRVLDLMDQNDMWKDTMLIVCTDHGFMLGEHDHWAKCYFPFYNEIANTPLFIWDPRTKKQNERRKSLVQTIDLPATLLEFFGLPLPADMQGKPLVETIRCDAPVREGGLYGIHGGQICCTDGRYTYLRSPVSSNEPLYQYTLMPTRHGDRRAFFSDEELKTMERCEPLPFTKGLPVMRTKAHSANNQHLYPTMLFDTEKDPMQMQPLNDPEQEARMCRLMQRLMKENDAPAEQFVRMGFEQEESGKDNLEEGVRIS